MATFKDVEAVGESVVVPESSKASAAGSVS